MRRLETLVLCLVLIGAYHWYSSSVRAEENEQTLFVLSYLLRNEEFGNSTVRISVGKANLRSAPSLDSEIIMQIAGGSELLVEQKVGEWTQVYCPSGGLCWVNSSVIEKS